MAEDTRPDATPMQKYLEHLIQMMTENQEFLRENAKELCDEAVDFINDAIDYVVLVTKKNGSRELYVERSMVFYLYHVLMPFSYAIYPDALLGNIPGCLMELRLLLESLVRCYAADSWYAKSTFFHERLELLEEKGLRSNKLMREVGRQLRLDNEFADLWNELSREWVHTKGIVDRVVHRLASDSGVPPWALVIPVNYTEDDLEALDHLRQQISRFRSLLAMTMDQYQQEIGF